MPAPVAGIFFYTNQTKRKSSFNIQNRYRALASFSTNKKMNAMKKESLLQTEEAIAFVKATFAKKLCHKLKLSPVTSPIAITAGTGINDDLNGTELPVSFRIKHLEQDAQVVQSLAKWKRIRLKELDIQAGRGVLTDMRALRPDEILSPLHSVYVDQWDWEKHIRAEDRHLDYLKKTVRKIYKAIRATEKKLAAKDPDFSCILPEKITFIHTEDLQAEFPGLSPAERETEAARKYGAIFLIGIGSALADGKAHDGRAPDYDDWSTPSSPQHKGLNGDIILWNPVLQRAFEVSSMGIRVDKQSLLHQLQLCGCEQRQHLHFHQMLLSDQLPQSIGGGIGQSRLAMFLLRKKHIAQVQIGIWPEALAV